MTGENALAVCLIRLFMASICPITRSRSRRVFSSPRAIEVAAEIVH
jgi:hypothetical protein